MNWRIIILLLAFSSSALAQRITPAKVSLSYAWALEVNPAADLAHVFVNLAIDREVYNGWEIIDARGRTVSQGVIVEPNFRIPTSSLSKGSYFLKLSGYDSDNLIPVIK
ncbi:T9SS type A sorting domain-containing protein [Salibacteraceae bacterium]|nr:T9SS type A sorting domain-containing protein [Salibacteraceae bacterium]